MFDKIGSKLLGDKSERAVSPVIGVILMVAITVILAAVIATFVLDMGGSLGQEAQGAAAFDVDTDDENITVEVTSLQNADHIELSGDLPDDDTTTDGKLDAAIDGDHEDMAVGETVTLNYAYDDGAGTSNEVESGTVTAVAVLDVDGETVRTTVGSQEFDFS